MSFVFHVQYKIDFAHAPASGAMVSFDFQQPNRHYFPPSGFLYLNMLTPPPAEAVKSSVDLSIQWQVAQLDEPLKYCQMLTGGILTKGPIVMDMTGPGYWSVLVLHPVLAYYFIQDRLDVVANGFADLCSLIGKAGEQFKSQMEDGIIHSWQSEPVLQFLHQRIGQANQWVDDPIFHAVNLIIEQKGRIGVRELAARVFMSERNLERQFCVKVGVSPKAYANIWRFQYALQLLRSRTTQSLEDLVQEAGYYDISHCMKDLRQKTGAGFEQFLGEMPALLQAHQQIIQEK